MKLSKDFKEQGSKIPDQVYINKLSKQLDIRGDETEKWFYWVEKCFQYLESSKEYQKILKEYNIYEKEYALKTNYFMIQKPEIKKKE